MTSYTADELTKLYNELREKTDGHVKHKVFIEEVKSTVFDPIVYKMYWTFDENRLKKKGFKPDKYGKLYVNVTISTKYNPKKTTDTIQINGRFKTLESINEYIKRSIENKEFALIQISERIDEDIATYDEDIRKHNEEIDRMNAEAEAAESKSESEASRQSEIEKHDERIESIIDLEDVEQAPQKSSSSSSAGAPAFEFSASAGAPAFDFSAQLQRLHEERNKKQERLRQRLHGETSEKQEETSEKQEETSEKEEKTGKKHTDSIDINFIDQLFNPVDKQANVTPDLTRLKQYVPVETLDKYMTSINNALLHGNVKIFDETGKLLIEAPTQERAINGLLKLIEEDYDKGTKRIYNIGSKFSVISMESSKKGTPEMYGTLMKLRADLSLKNEDDMTIMYKIDDIINRGVKSTDMEDLANYITNIKGRTDIRGNLKLKTKKETMKTVQRYNKFLSNKNTKRKHRYIDNY